VLLIKVTYSGATPDMAKRALNELYKQSFGITGKLWHTRFHRKHFTHRGAREYRYSPRHGERMSKGSKRYRQSYTGRKERTFGHTLPLVLTGASRKLASIKDVRATSKGARVVIHARGLNRRRRGAKQSMRAEMTTISAGEEKVMIERFGAAMMTRLNRVKGRRTKRL
jgi:hypothetical protein